MLTEKILHPVRPSAAIGLAYRKRLLKLVDELHNSIQYWVCVAYRANEPEVKQLLAQDASPANMLRTVIRRLARRWQKKFNQAADELAQYFGTETAKRSDAALASILRRGGFSVRFKKTRAVNDALQAIIAENVSLIRSIPSQNFTQIEGMVMRSVSAGRDLQSLTNELQGQFAVSRRRATLIARDQNNKATAAIQKIRQVELGIKEAVWVHSGGGKEPRPTHVKAGRDRVRYNIAEGWLDPAIKKYIWPGTEINCRCVARPVIPGFS